MTDLPTDYAHYLRRFGAEVGTVPVGGYAKWRTRLIRKLSDDEFSAKVSEYHTLQQLVDNVLARGDTLDNAILRVFREVAAELLVDAGV